MSGIPPRRPRHASLSCPACSVEATLSLIDGKWKGVILWHLLGGTLRFGELRRKIPSVTQRMLTTQLRELEADGLITRTVFPVIPPRVEYSLTELGFSLEKLLFLLKSWGDEHRFLWSTTGKDASPIGCSVKKDISH